MLDGPLSSNRQPDDGRPAFPQARHVAVHPVTDGAFVQPTLRAQEVHAVHCAERVRCVEDAEVVVDTVALDIGVATAPVDGRRLQVQRGRTETAERPFVPGKISAGVNRLATLPPAPSTPAAAAH